MVGVEATRRGGGRDEGVTWLAGPWKAASAGS